MKKVLFSLAFLLIFVMSTAFAAPINDLATGQTAIGAGSDNFYLEHKLTDSFTLGFQNVDWGSGLNANDIYGQFQLSSNLRGIVGSRNWDSGSKMYLGLAVNGAMGPEWEGYASIIGGNNFKEVQAGANFRLTHNVDLNLNYHSFMPDFGPDKNGVGVGVTFKF